MSYLNDFMYKMLGLKKQEPPEMVDVEETMPPSPDEQRQLLAAHQAKALSYTPEPRTAVGVLDPTWPTEYPPNTGSFDDDGMPPQEETAPPPPVSRSPFAQMQSMVESKGAQEGETAQPSLTVDRRQRRIQAEEESRQKRLQAQAAFPRKPSPPRLKTTLGGPGPGGLGSQYFQDGVPVQRQADPVSALMGQKGGLSLLAKLIGGQQQRPDPWGEQAVAAKMALADKVGENRLAVAGAQAEPRRYAADQSLAGRQYAANAGSQARGYAADRRLEGTKYTADTNYDIAGMKTKSAEKIAGMNIQSAKDVANIKRELSAAHDRAHTAAAAAHDKEDYRESLMAARARVAIAKDAKDKEPGWFGSTKQGRTDLQRLQDAIEASLSELGVPQ